MNERRKQLGVVYWIAAAVTIGMVSFGAINALGPHADAFIDIAAGLALATTLQVALIWYFRVR